jgi:hypothetical protein
MDMHKLFIVSSATINFPLIKDWQLTEGESNRVAYNKHALAASRLSAGGYKTQWWPFPFFPEKKQRRK